MSAKEIIWCTMVVLMVITIGFLKTPHRDNKKIGVILVLHGGMDTYHPQYLWDSSIQMFSYDPNHPVYTFVIWNAKNWNMVLNSEFATKFLRKYAFEYERIGGRDPFHRISDAQLSDMKATLDDNPYGFTFEVDYACWMAGDKVSHYPYPRFLYHPPSEKGDACTYCGENEKDGPWPDCKPNRYDVDGPAERLLKKGVSRIIMIDLTVGGPRFYKTYDVVQMTKRVLNNWNGEHGTSIPLIWVNDYSNAMERSYPSQPEGWTSFLGAPLKDERVLLNGSLNPLVTDPALAALHVEGIEASMSKTVPDAQTGVVLFNHGLFDDKRSLYDPKIDDTLILNKRIKSQLLAKHPEMDPDHIVGAWGGEKELNPENNLIERTRRMRGEDLAYAHLHDSDRQMPADEWGYRYWEALEYLKNKGVKHIVIGFPQVISDSVLTMVELYNQVAKEIGTKTWAHSKRGNFTWYPEVGHPFADYWGNWVTTVCNGEACCFEMGGCADGRVYPPPRQTPLDQKRGDMDPSLAFDVSEYGHLGYDPTLGPPDPNRPVQNQYQGTWEIYRTPSADPRVGALLARHVLNAARYPLVYLTNGEKKGIKVGENVTWEAHVTGGKPAYHYEWTYRKEGTNEWLPLAENASTFTWTPEHLTPGIYAVRCKVTDSEHLTGEITWEGFEISPS